MVDIEVVVYTGEGEKPQFLTMWSAFGSIPPSRRSQKAFFGRTKLAEVELCEGLVEIGERSFRCCEHSITKIIIPTSLRRIGDWAFYSSLRTPIHLHDGIESIGGAAFANCIFTNFRVPPLITVIPVYLLSGCKLMFSLELTEDMIEIGSSAFSHCYCLRNVAIPPNAALADDVFVDVELNERLNQNLEGKSEELQRLIKKYCWTDLQRLFGGSEERILRELRHRFDGLPIHKLVYYHTYYQGVLQILIQATNSRSCQRRTLRSKLDPTGNQQDCLGMTPLHILACSSSHDLDLYCVIVEKYPTNLITEDRWGALPLLYALWGAAPDEIIEFLLESYHTLYP